MRVPFYKYQATGNDFVIINQFEVPYLINPNKELVSHLCHRRFGVGADGLMIIEKCKDADFKMVYYNSDGALSSMCGNGGRSIAHLAHKIGIVGETGQFSAVDGLHKFTIHNDAVSLSMNQVLGCEKSNDHYFLNTGSPHFVQFVENVHDLNVKETGREIRYSADFQPNGTNVNFVQSELAQIIVRTYERGVEDETYSCGTGVTAAALAFSIENGFIDSQHEVAVNTMGGDLKVSFRKKDKDFSEITLIGPAVCSFEGFIDLEL